MNPKKTFKSQECVNVYRYCAFVPFLSTKHIHAYEYAHI